MVGGFPWHRTSNAENVSMAWHHHACLEVFIITHAIFITSDVVPLDVANHQSVSQMAFQSNSKGHRFPFPVSWACCKYENMTWMLALIQNWMIHGLWGIIIPSSIILLYWPSIEDNCMICISKQTCVTIDVQTWNVLNINTQCSVNGFH